MSEAAFSKDLEDTIRGKSINGRTILQKPISTLTDAKECHVLFVSSSESKRLGEILDILRTSSVLTVGETDKFIAAGGIINFVSEGKRIRFQINDVAAKAAGLKISSKLLSLAVPAK
jgi:hypothetical protein